MKVTQERLKELFRYEPSTGRFIRRTDVGGGHVAGTVAGTTSGTDEAPFRRIQIEGSMYLEARLAWLYVTGKWPAACVNFRNGNPLDIRWQNLQSATRTEVAYGRRGWRKSRTKGVFRIEQSSGVRWRALIIADGERRHLGYFLQKRKAQAAYDAAAKQLHGEFARR